MADLPERELNTSDASYITEIYQQMSEADVGAGLVLPYVAQTVAGKGGAAALLLVIFMVCIFPYQNTAYSSYRGQSCTSIASAQMIATSSILSFDIYGTYFNKKATDKDLIRWSHIGVVATSIFISTIATAFHRGGVDMVCASPSLIALQTLGHPQSPF